MAEVNSAGSHQPDSMKFKTGREKLGWTRPQLAAVLGVSVATVEAWEKGTRSVTADIDNLARFDAISCLEEKKKVVLGKYSLKDTRRLLGYRVDELAAVTGMNMHSIRAAEKGARTAPETYIRQIEALLSKRISELQNSRSK